METNVKSLSTIGIIMPRDFQTKPYEAVHTRVEVKQNLNQLNQNTFEQYAWAWNAVAYRFISCMEHHEAFTKSILFVGSSQENEKERYVQENGLFGFFVSGLSTIESFCYGLFAIASMIDVNNFPIASAKDMRNITPEKTVNKFNKHIAFQNEKITDTLEKIIKSQDYLDWSEIRNILAHRGAYGRHFHIGGNMHGQVLWIKGFSINQDTTASRYKWLVIVLSNLLTATDSFTEKFL